MITTTPYKHSDGLFGNSSTSSSGDLDNILKSIRGGSGVDSSQANTSFDWSNNSFWNRDNKGLTISPKGMGYGLAGMGALAGLALPGKDTPWWQRLLYALAGAGLLGSAGYLGGGLLGEGKGWTLPGGLGGYTEKEQKENLSQAALAALASGSGSP